MNLIMDLIPITKTKIEKQKWLETKIKYDKNKTIKEVLEEMSFNIYKWSYNQEEFNTIVDYETFKNNFINLVYDKYL